MTNLYAYVHMYIEKNGRTYAFLMPLNAPFDDCKEAAAEIAPTIDKMIEDAKARAAAAEAEKKKAPESPEAAQC